MSQNDMVIPKLLGTPLTIRDLVGMIKRGEILLPEMQRRYVWSPTQVRDLLDSLYRGYPSGTILTWELSDQEKKNIVKKEAAIKQDESQRDIELLLDGQQRLTSLAALLYGYSVTTHSKEKKPIKILFNLKHSDSASTTEVPSDENEEGEEANLISDDNNDSKEKNLPSNEDEKIFSVYNLHLANDDNPHWISVADIFDEKANLIEILERAGLDPKKDQKYLNRLYRLQNIKEYSYTVYRIGKEKSLEEATEIFIRVNSKGTKLRSSDLALAQITAKWRGSLKIFQMLKINIKAKVAI